MKPRLLFLGTSNIKNICIKLINAQQITSASGFKLYIENSNFEHKIKSRYNLALGQS